MKITLKFLMIFLIPLWVKAESPPVLYFSDLTDGPTSGWEGSATKGAAVSIWGNHFGTNRGSSYVTVGGVNLSQDSDYAEWGVINRPAPGEDPNDVYSSARGLERITFWLNSNMQTGPGTISVTTSNGTSDSIPFYCRSLGGNHIYFVSNAGDNNYDGLAGSYVSGVNGPWATTLKVKVSLQTGDIAYFRTGTWTMTEPWGALMDFGLGNHNNGEENKGIAIASYPGEVANFGGNVAKLAFFQRANGQLHYWTFSKFMFRTRQSIVNWSTGYCPGGSGSSSYNRFIGNDMSTKAGATSILSFTGKVGGQSYLSIYGNYIHDGGVNARGDRSSSSSYGIYMQGYGNHDQIDIGWNEIAYQSNGRGIQLYGHCVTDWIDNVYIHDNYIHHNAYQALVLGGGDPGGYTFLRTAYIYNNVCAWNGNTDWITPGSYGPRGPKPNVLVSVANDVYLYNNVLYQSDNTELHLPTANDLISFKNNIVVPSAGGRYLIDEQEYAVMDASNNCFYGGSGIIPPWDTNPIEADPQFIAPDLPPDIADFRLLANSPCIDAGTSELSLIVGNDYVNTLRPQGTTYDIGAYEYIPTKPGVEDVLRKIRDEKRGEATEGEVKEAVKEYYK